MRGERVDRAHFTLVDLLSTVKFIIKVPKTKSALSVLDIPEVQRFVVEIVRMKRSGPESQTQGLAS